MSKTNLSTVQSIFKFRKQIEESRAIVLKNSKATLSSEEEKLEELEQKKCTMLSAEENVNEDKVELSLYQLQVCEDYQAQLDGMIVNQTSEVEKILQKVEIDRDLLNSAAMDKKAVEKLRERRVAEDLKTKRRKEEKVESEIAIRVDAGKTRMVD
jgi:flagellar export protein FliJ